MSPSSVATSYGQVIEYIQDRLYLASYTHAPNAQTPFPYPAASKRSARSGQAVAAPNGPSVHPPVYFSIDDSLLYNAFHHDFGPLHIGHLYRFAVQLHDVLGDPENEGRGVVFWSKADSRSRANAACLLACYMVLIQSWPPHLALAPIAQADPPLMPFRDAGYSQADYVINVQDVVYGVWRAQEQGLCGLRDFSLEEYEKYERVDMGDFNWLTPSFLAFASPQHTPTTPIPTTSPLYSTLPTTVSAIASHPTLPGPFKNVLAHFAERNIGLVVRLNSELYSPTYFTTLGISHIDMIFDDGTCPPLPLVRRFINLAHDTITIKQKGIAIHCKAGLGRTGCLIGAYLIYRHGFTANEIIAFMRFMRPGMVVGPQQHWLHLNQGAFREWWYEDTIKAQLTASMLPSTPTKASQRASRIASNKQYSTPPNASAKTRAPLGDIDQNGVSVGSSPPVPSTHNVEDDTNLPAPTPGQPRKVSRSVRHQQQQQQQQQQHHHHHPYSRQVSSSTQLAHDRAGTNAVSTEKHCTSTDSETDRIDIQRQLGVASAHPDGISMTDESEEEVHLRLLRTRRTSSRSPIGISRQQQQQQQKERRAVSCSTSSTTISTSTFSSKTSTISSKTSNPAYGAMADNPGEDIENRGTPPSTMGRKMEGGAGMGTVTKTRVGAGLARGSDRESGPWAGGVRKHSGRVGSMGAAAAGGRKS